MKSYFFYFIFLIPLFCFSFVKPGVEVFFESETNSLHGKKIGIITNQTGIDRNLVLTSKKFLENADKYEIKAGRIGNIHGEKNDPIPARAETIILISAIVILYFY